MASLISRRESFQLSAAIAACLLGTNARGDHAASSKDRILGMLMGSALGDALGGPVEFGDPAVVRPVMPNARDWDDHRRLDVQERERLADRLTLHSYEVLRPDPAPYGPWRRRGPAGTITDDTRMKIVLLRALARSEKGRPLTKEVIAEELVRFQPIEGKPASEELSKLTEEGLAEFRLAANWLLGERDEARALPSERLWAGIATCAGQMMMPPLAGCFAGRPEAAYRATYELDFIDAPLARDFCAALNAGLAAALSPKLDHRPIDVRWSALFDAMRNVDPLRIARVPFTGRPLHRWLDLADQLAGQADGRPALLYESLEQRGHPVYWWDAHFTLLVPLAMLRFCRYDPLATLHLCLDFGHDTDSYAQVAGAMIGAVCGPGVFPARMCAAVAERLRVDFHEDIFTWPAVLSEAFVGAP